MFHRAITAAPAIKQRRRPNLSTIYALISVPMIPEELIPLARPSWTTRPKPACCNRIELYTVVAILHGSECNARGCQCADQQVPQRHERCYSRSGPLGHQLQPDTQPGSLGKMTSALCETTQDRDGLERVVLAGFLGCLGHFVEFGLDLGRGRLVASYVLEHLPRLFRSAGLTKVSWRIGQEAHREDEEDGGKALECKREAPSDH